MKGYRFYLEYENKTEKNKATVKKVGNHLGTVIAVILDENNRPYWQTGSLYMDCISGVYYEANSAVTFGSVHKDYLQEKCKRIPEKLARIIHPKMFDYLNNY